jgi:hypothetical protein
VLTSYKSLGIVSSLQQTFSRKLDTQMRNFLSNNAPMIIITTVIIAFCAVVLATAPLLTLAHLLVR